MKFVIALIATVASTSAFAAQGITEWDCDPSTNVYTITMNEAVSSPTIVLDGTAVAGSTVSAAANIITVTGAANCPPASLTITIGGNSYGDALN